MPGSGRQAWRQHNLEQARQYSAFLQGRGESPAVIRRKLRKLCLQAIREAFRERLQDADPRTRVVRLARSPVFFAAVALLMLTGLSLGTGMFSGLRTVYGPLPYADAGSLVACYQVHFLSLSWGVQVRYIRPWQEQSKTLEGLAAYQIQNFKIAPPGRPEIAVGGARVTEGFFDLLRVKPAAGRLFQPGDSTGEPLVVLSHEIWRTEFGADPNAPGKEVTLEGRTARVAGVLPSQFWFRSREAAVWTLLPDLGRPDPTLRLLSTIGRRASGATEEDVRAELQNIAWSTSRFRGAEFRIAPLGDSAHPTLLFLMVSFGGGMALALAIALIQFLRSWLQRGDEPREALRYWAFFLFKSVLLLALMGAIGAELAARNALALHPGRFALGLLIDWASVLVALLVLHWTVLDQSRRCPVCLRRLTLPVSSGTWSSALFEPATTELLCDQGHGSLWYGEAPTTLGAIRRWITLEASWRELLTPENKT